SYFTSPFHHPGGNAGDSFNESITKDVTSLVGTIVVPPGRQIMGLIQVSAEVGKENAYLMHRNLRLEARQGPTGSWNVIMGEGEWTEWRFIDERVFVYWRNSPPGSDIIDL